MSCVRGFIIPYKGKEERQMQISEKQRRMLAWAAALLIVALVSLSALFIATHAAHDCTGEDCAVCAELKVCGSAVRGLGKAVAAVAVSVILLKLAEVLCSFTRIRCFAAPASLVSLKIRLNN